MGAEKLRGMARGVSRSTEADTPHPQQMATATEGTHPTGMHSCL